MRFQCENCEKIVSIDDSECGQTVGCGHCNSVTTVPQTRVSPNALISDFVIRRTLGSGGMGTVYLAHQLSLDRPVALKILLSQFAHNSEFIVDFVREARAAARLNHPNIVQSYAVGEDEGIYFFAMEFVEGDTLKTVLNKAGQQDWKESFNIIQQIAEALDFAWKNQQLVHRDIKPDNIMLTKRGIAKLADLGLARAAHETSDDDDEVMGTPQYICPEQLLGQPMDVRGDIYSLGATLFHAISGNFPFEGNSAADIARKHLSAPVPDPREYDPSIPASAAYVVQRMMAKRLEDRYDDAEELVVDMGLVLRGQKPVGMKESDGDKLKKTKTSKTGRAKPVKRTAATGRHAAAAASGRQPSSRPSVSATGRNASSPRKKSAVTAPSRKKSPPPPPPPTEGKNTMSSGKIKSTKLKSTRAKSPGASGVEPSPSTPAASGYQRPGTPTAPVKAGGNGKVVVILLVLVILGILSGVTWFVSQMMKFNFKTAKDAKSYYLFQVASQSERDDYQELEGYFDGKYDQEKALEVLAKANQFQKKYPNSLFARGTVKNPEQWAILYKVPMKITLISENIPKTGSVWINQIPIKRAEVFIPKAIMSERVSRIEEEKEQIELNQAIFYFDEEKVKVWSELEMYAGEFVREYERNESRLSSQMSTNEAHYKEEKDTILKTILKTTTMCDFGATKLYMDQVSMLAMQRQEYPNTIKNDAIALSREVPLEQARKKLGEFHRRFDAHKKGGTVEREEINEAFLGFINGKGHEATLAKIRALPGRERELFDKRKQWIDSHVAALNCAQAYFNVVASTGSKFGEGFDTKNVKGIRRVQNKSNIAKILRRYGWTSPIIKAGDQVWVTSVTNTGFVVQVDRYTNEGSILSVGKGLNIPHWEAVNLAIFHYFAAQVKETCTEDFDDARACFEFYVRPTFFKKLDEGGKTGGANSTFLKDQVDKAIELWSPGWAVDYVNHMKTGLRKMRSDERQKLVSYLEEVIAPLEAYRNEKEFFDKAAP